MVSFLIVVLLLAAIVELVSLRDALKRITYYSKPSVRVAEPDSEFTLSVTVENKGKLPISYILAKIRLPMVCVLPEGLTVRDSKFKKECHMVFRFRPLQRIKRELRLKISKRGVYSFDGADVLRGDFLGIRNTIRDYLLSEEVIVYPERTTSDKLLSSVGNYCGEVSSRRWLIRDPILTVGVREYTGYEPMNTISWARTAAKGEIMVRDFDYTRDPSCKVLLSLNGLKSFDVDTVDKLCVIARCLCEKLAESGINVDFYTNASILGFSGGKVKKCSGNGRSIDDILETLSRAGSYPLSSPEMFGAYCRNDGSTPTAYAIVCPAHDDSISRLCSALIMDNEQYLSVFTPDDFE